MIKIKEIIIVEGKYDAIAVRGVCDSAVIETRGFRIFKDKELRTWIKKLAREKGIIILTDSDSSGFKIRNYIESFVDKKYVKNAYIPTIKGKEKRKAKPSSEGFLGVEGISEKILSETLLRAGASVENHEKKQELITKADLYSDGICGRENSVEKKRAFLKKTGLPLRLSNTKLVEAINLSMTKNEYEKLVKEL
ncbi:MAG: DUF4093 domain-containing protein [Clostridiales bacterium]|nr:DUF4093 domain-containing protein [Clostridiales bacterium]